tara:strand:- start:858 stop:1013 length:156 start_codon:yes stop_codon:yes gene_type:complete
MTESNTYRVKMIRTNGTKFDEYIKANNAATAKELALAKNGKHYKALVLECL